MKLSKEDLKAKVNELVADNEIAIQLLEDIEDSMEVSEVDTAKVDELQAKLDEVQAKLDDLQEKYKERFLKGEDKPEEKSEEKVEELKEEEIVDVKEI